MRDPYEVLGVDRKASAADIKSAYRRLAKKLHPDANKNDPKAATRFAELNAAYEILGDEDKRKAFDRGEIDAEGKPRFQGFAGGGAGGRAPGFGGDGNFESFTCGPEGFTRTARRGRGGASGAGGGGSAAASRISCKELFGGGAPAAARAQFRAGGFRRRRRRSGRDVRSSLPDAANGATQRLHLPTGKDVDVKIPAGLTDGQHIRLKGQGMAGPGGRGRRC